eukprot:1159866-Pelagomonas_calceolata.AAC.2
MGETSVSEVKKKRTAKLVASKQEFRDVPEKQKPLSSYMQLPASQYSVLEQPYTRAHTHTHTVEISKLVSRACGDTFRGRGAARVHHQASIHRVRQTSPGLRLNVSSQDLAVKLAKARCVQFNPPWSYLSFELSACYIACLTVLTKKKGFQLATSNTEY